MDDIRHKTFLDELRDYEPPGGVDQHALIDNQASQIIASVGNLYKLIESTYSPEVSNDLKKRLILSLKDADYSKFHRKIKSIRGI